MKTTSSGFPSTSQTQGMWMSFGRRMPSPTPWVYYTHTKWNISGIAITQLRTAPVSGKLCRLSGLNLKCSIFNSYDCAHKRTKGLATVLVTQLEPKEAGGPVPPPIFTLSRIHSPEPRRCTIMNLAMANTSLIGDYQWNIINCMVQLLKPLLKSTCQPY